jgi:hypothetical protein
MIKSLMTCFMLMILASSLSSCKLFKSKKSKTSLSDKEAQIQSIDSTSAIIKGQSIQDSSTSTATLLIDSTVGIWSKNIDFSTYSCKAKLNYDGSGKNYDLNANIRIRKDSVIWISVNMGGIIQVARAIISPDSFKAIIPTEKKAYIGAISRLNDFIPAGLNYFTLQNLLVGNHLINDVNASFANKSNDELEIQFKNNNYIEQVIYTLLDSTLKKSTLVSSVVENAAISTQYNNYIMINNWQIPTNIIINVANKGDIHNINFNYSNIQLNETLSYPFSIPQNYKIE